MVENKKNEPQATTDIREMIKATVLKMGPNVSKELKQEHARLLLKIFEKGLLPKDAMEIADKEIGYLYSYAYSLFASGQYKESCELFKLLLALDPVQADFATALGVCHHRMKNFQYALDAYMLATILNPLNPVPFFYAYDCLMNLKSIASAGIMLSNVVSRAGNDPKYAKMKERAQVLLESIEKEISSTEPQAAVTEKQF